MFTWLITRDPAQDRLLIQSEITSIPGKVTRRKINGNRRIWQARFYYGSDVVELWIGEQWTAVGDIMTNCTYTRKSAGV